MKGIKETQNKSNFKCSLNLLINSQQIMLKNLFLNFGFVSLLLLNGILKLSMHTHIAMQIIRIAGPVGPVFPVGPVKPVY